MSKTSVSLITSARIPTAYGDFRLCYYSNTLDNKEHLAFVQGTVADAENVLVRIHSECFTGDVLGSRRCDCGEQLDRSLQMIGSQGAGVLIYLRQEGRGIGLLPKLKAYNLQDQGYDTVDANLLLGHGADERDYSLAARILENLGIESVRLLTNNPAKLLALENEGIRINTRIPLETAINPDNEDYLLTKALRMDHLLQLRPNSLTESPANAHALESAN